MLRKLFQLAAVIAFALVSNTGMSQVTNSAITGAVRDPKGQLLEGATIRAEHLPTGTQYSTFSTRGGSFTLPGLRTGGPYKVEITYTGYAPAVFEGIILQLGEPFNLAVGLKENESVLENVVVTSPKRKGAVDKTGASTNISNRQITTLPTISRSLTDFTRLTPQAQGNSFGGRDGRYNNLQIDGANLNNNFGLSTDPLPGGGNQPISLDAIEEVTVNIAPYDVRQSGFTGAGINAITKSGTNKFKGAVYGYFRDQDMNGTKVGSAKLPPLQTSESQILGAYVGGAIIKNKLFFFVNAETEERTFPGVTLVPTGVGITGANVSNTHIDSLNKLENFVKTKYGYDAGGATNFPSFAVKNRKLLGRIDWNISKNHKLTLKYSDLLVSQDDQNLNGSSVPNNPTFRPTGASGSLSRLPNNRFSNNSFAFANSNYGFERVVKSGTFELNSNFNRKFSNQLLATATKIQDTRTYKGGLFPTVDIFNNNGQNYMSIGIDPFTYNNDVINDVYNITDNLTYNAGKHTLTGGITYEYQRVGNMFMPGAASYYAFNSMDDFINNRAPAVFSLTYALDKTKSSVYAADLKIGQLGFYVQDDFNVNDRFKLTYGVRFDKPIYLDAPISNPAFAALTFADKNGQPAKYSTGIWPKDKILASPRIGFRWDVEGDKRMVIRGGMGIFTGRIPFVWLTNIPQNSFMLQAAGTVTDPARLNNYRFNPDPLAYRDSFPSTAGTSILNNANFVVADPNFKFPQVWRTNIAVDQNLGNGFLLTLEALYSKDINAVVMRNANEKPTNGVLANGDDTRPRFLATADRRINSAIGTAIVLENTNKGQQFTGTAQLSKSFANGFYGSFAYTYFYADDVTSNPGSQATSVWNSNPTTGTQNLVQGATSAFAVPHRIVATLSYRKEYLKHFATTVSLFYQGSAQSRYTYVYNGDLNNDGNNTTDLLYNANPSTIPFVNIPVSSTNPAVKFTAAQQTAAWSEFVENTKYLRDRKGQYAERNGALLPWFNQLDFKLLQDLFTNIGKSKNTVQFSIDILNFANMLNSDWGIRKAVTFSNPLIVNSVNATTGVPNFRLQELNGQLVTKPTQNVIGTSSTWGMQLGLRYIFN